MGRNQPAPFVPDSSPLRGIAFKIASVTIFVAMSALIKAAGQMPVGQIVFFRSFFAMLPILALLAFRRELATAFVTSRPVSHFARGIVGVASMGFGFFALTRLPLPESIALNYAQPLLVTVFSAIFLGEMVRVYRWTAVGIGFIGVVIICWPKLTLFTSGTGLDNREVIGVAAALSAAAISACALLLVRNLVRTEKSATIVLWFSLTASCTAALTFPFGWYSLTPTQMACLVGAGFCGGIAQILMTEAYRYAEASTVAPFEYTSMLLAVAIGYLVFSDLPTIHMLVGSVIVIGAGIFIVWREQRLGIERAAAKKVSPPQ